MTLDGMNGYLEAKGFEVCRERDSKRNCYVFSIRKPGYETLTRDFKYPGGNDWNYRNSVMEEFLDGMVRDYYKGEKKDMKNRDFERALRTVTFNDGLATLQVSGAYIPVKIETYTQCPDAPDQIECIVADHMVDYCRNDVEMTKKMTSYYRNMEHVKDVYNTLTSTQKNAVYELVGRCLAEKTHIPEITNVIFNDPATIVFWADGSKTVVKCQEGDTFNPEFGLAMAISKKALGNQGNYANVFKNWLPENEPEEVPCLYPEFKIENEKLVKALEQSKEAFSKFCDELVAKKKRGREEV